jgi:NAD(P)H-flavin reductase/hemoglobin-like flavoprotein
MGLSAYELHARLNHVAIALGGRFADSGADSLVRPDSIRSEESLSAQVTPPAVVSVADPVTGASHSGSADEMALCGTRTADGKTAETAPTVADVNSALVKQSFAQVISSGPAAAEYFYARLFTRTPGVRAMFPATMTAHRERMFAAFSRLIWTLDAEPEHSNLLAQLGRDHRRFGVLSKHYEPFLAAMRDTIEHCLGANWTAETSSAWRAALDSVAARMQAAAAAAQDSPAWWVAEIVSHELRSPGVAVVRLRTEQQLPYQAGQYVQVQVTRWPRTWRPYSVATAPRPHGLLELHVRAVPGGLVSNTLVHHSDVGDCVLLGAAEGAMTLTASDRDLLCLAGGTGLAPIKAIIEHAITAAKATRRARKITLFVGARQEFDLYDLEDLQLLEAACPSLRVIPVLSEQPGYTGLTGTLSDAVSVQGLCENTEAYVCGPAAMVRHTRAALAGYVPADRIRYDPLP